MHEIVYLGDLPKTFTANQSIWRDIKVYKDDAFIVSDGAGAHHMQIFDLTQLRCLLEPQVFTETALYKGIYSSHNLIINEEIGYAYAAGSDSGGETFGGALHMIDIQDPLNPVFAGCFADMRTGGRGTGATHDAQCVTCNGLDQAYKGREICFSSNGDALSIADLTDKDAPVALSVARYPNVAYTHQGGLTEDHRYFYLNDEGDEYPSENLSILRMFMSGYRRCDLYRYEVGSKTIRDDLHWSSCDLERGRGRSKFQKIECIWYQCRDC